MTWIIHIDYVTTSGYAGRAEWARYKTRTAARKAIYANDFSSAVITDSATYKQPAALAIWTYTITKAPLVLRKSQRVEGWVDDISVSRMGQLQVRKIVDGWCAYIGALYLGIFPTREDAKAACEAHAKDQGNV